MGIIYVRVPVCSSSSSNSDSGGGQYESSPDVKRYLVSALGNINHTLCSCFLSDDHPTPHPTPPPALWSAVNCCPGDRGKAVGNQ